MTPEPTNLFLALAQDVEAILAILNRADQSAEVQAAELRACQSRLPGACKEIVVALELAGHATVAARVGRECKEFLNAVWKVECLPKGGRHPGETPVSTWAQQQADELVATLKALSRFLSENAALSRLCRPQPDDGGPYYPPRHFLERYNISPESLRDAKRKEQIRVRQPRSNVKRYHYSEPDVRRLWPHRFRDTPPSKP